MCILEESLDVFIWAYLSDTFQALEFTINDSHRAKRNRHVACRQLWNAMAE